VKAGLFHFPGLIKCVYLLLNSTLTWLTTLARNAAKELAVKLLSWHRRDNENFKTYTIMLKLCSEELMRTRSGRRYRAQPSSRLAVFFLDNSDVAKHTLSFLDTNSDQLRNIAAMVNTPESL
jgi:hypothetical protein